MKEKLYDITFLNHYLSQRSRGFGDSEIDALLEADDFLREVVSGLEMSQKEYPDHENINTVLSEKREKIWKTLQTAAQSQPTTFVVERQSLTKKVAALWRLIRNDLRDFELYYLLSFHCGCILFMLSFSFWIGMSPEGIGLPAAINLGEGFKP